MRRNTFSALFLIRKTRINKVGESPILLRITVNGISQEATIGRTVVPEAWNQQAGRVVSKNRYAFEIKVYLDTVRMRVMQIQRQMELNGKHITAREMIELLHSAIIDINYMDYDICSIPGLLCA